MYCVLSGFIYKLDTYISSYSDGIAISKKYSYPHAFLWDLWGLFSILKRWREFKQ